MRCEDEIISIMVTWREYQDIKEASSLIKTKSSGQGVSIKDYFMLLHNDWLVRREEIPEQATGYLLNGMFKSKP